MPSSFDLDPEVLSQIDIDGPLTAAPALCCEYYNSCYWAAEVRAREEGRAADADVYLFLARVTGLMLSFENPAEPYQPMIQLRASRSLALGDLVDEDVPSLRTLAERTPNEAL